MFTPPKYLVPPLAGIDVSASGVKAARLARAAHGLVLTHYAEVPFTTEVMKEGEVVDRGAVVAALATAAQKIGVRAAYVALPEAKSYIFETKVTGTEKRLWHTMVEQHLEELVPLPPQNTLFDVVDVGHDDAQNMVVVGAGALKTTVDEYLKLFDDARISVQALETENFAMVRALIARHAEAAALIIDVGKTTTKMCIASHGTPRFATTIGIGGHPLTQAVQKHFGVTEAEAEKVKNEQGIVASAANDDYLGAVLSTVAAIRDEISDRLNYWQLKATPGGMYEPVNRVVLVGGNASVRGLPEYFENALRLPVTTGNVFSNFAPRDAWVPPLEYHEALTYTTAIGLALYGVEAV